MNVHWFERSFLGIVVGLCVWINGAGLRLEALQAKSEISVSPGLGKVVKLVESGVGEEIVLAYVRNTSLPKPNAEEIIYLHQAGVPAPVISALLSKNGIENRPAAPEAASSGRILAKPVYEQAPSAPASVVYVDRAPTYVQPQPTVVYVPSYTPQYYTYPAYSYYPRYAYPYYGSYYPWPAISLGFSFGGHRHFGHHSFGFGHHSFGHHGGHHFGHGGLRYIRH